MPTLFEFQTQLGEGIPSIAAAIVKLSTQDAALAEKDGIIIAKDKTIAELRAQLEALTVPPAPVVPPALNIDWTKQPEEYGLVVQAKERSRVTLVNVQSRRAVRLLTSPGDNNVVGSGDMERCDLSGHSRVYNEGVEQWWSLSLLFPDDFQFPTWQNYNLQGFHHTGSTGSGNFRIGFERGAGLPTTSPGTWVLRGHGGTQNQTQFIQPIGVPVRNTWYDFVYHVKWSATVGFFDVWLNGVRKLSHRGPTLYVGQGAYAKFANYHTPVCDPYPACVGTHKASSVLYGPVKMDREKSRVTSAVLE